MTELSDEARRALIDDALEKKFGDWLHWEKPQGGYCVGPSDPTVYDNLLEWCDKKVETAILDLQNLSDLQLKTIEAPPNEEDMGHSGWWAMYLRYSIPDLKKEMPSPFAFGFGHPSFRPDFKYWAQMPEFSLQELLVLSVGADPEKITKDTIASWMPSKSVPKPRKKLWPTQEFLLKRHEQLRRYFSSFVEGYLPMPIHTVKALIDEIELEVHPEFYEAIERRLARKVAKREVRSSDDFTNTERQTLLKMIAAMACEAYKFDPDLARNKATSEIQADVQAIGQTIDQKTILKWLKEASELVHEDFWSERRR